MGSAVFLEDFPSTFDAMRDALERALVALRSAGCIPEGHLFCARLCLEEALVNAMRHGNRGREEARVRLEISACDAECIIRIFDEGRGYDPEAIHPPTPEQLGGRGVCLMRHYMDTISYDETRGCLELRFSLARCQEGDRVSMDIPEEASVEFSKQGRVDIGTIHMASVLSPISISEFGDEVLGYVHARRGLYLLLNFEHVDYLSSAVLTELIKIHRAVRDTGVELRLCAVSRTIREIFRITNLDQMLGIHEDGLAPNLERFERAIRVAAQDKAWEEPAE